MRFVTPRELTGSSHSSPTTPERHRLLGRLVSRVWADPFSLAATNGVSVDFLSSGYLDVSVPPLTLSYEMEPRANARPRVSPLGNPRLSLPDG